MDKYRYADETSGTPKYNFIVANSYKDAEERIMETFANKMDDPELEEVYSYDDFTNLLYDNYQITLGYPEYVGDAEV